MAGGVESSSQDGKKELTGTLYTVVVVALLIICCAESVGFSVYNKYIFSGPLKTPIFATATHQIACFLGAFMVMLCSPARFYKRTKINSSKVWMKIMLIPLAFAMNIGMNNLSLKFTTLALNQLIRSFSPVAIAITSFLIEGKMQSIPKIITLSCLVLGVIMGVATSPDFELLGFLICAGSLLGQSLGIVMTAFVMAKNSVKLQSFDVLLYATLPSLVILLPWSFALGEFEVLQKSVEAEGAFLITGLLLAGGALAFTYNLLCTVFIRLTSSVYYGVTGGFRCAIAIAISFVLFPQKATWMSLTGIIIAMTAFVANSYFTMTEKLKAQEAAATAKAISDKHASKIEEGGMPEDALDSEETTRLFKTK
mmetsp:Transcript_10996/g.16440  ORF Transcript_10996/g.16440 Transcript_10996/m.16440 type:complete len:367 (+) Transcript_10996:2-1102(+)